MKKTTILTLFSALFILSINASAGGIWTQKATVPATARYYPAWFTIGHYGFVGCGYNGSYFKDFYKWNQTTNTWSGITSYPGNGSNGCSGFTIDGKGYVGFGASNSSRSTDLWQYDTATNAWTGMTKFPGSARYDQDCFVLGHKAYVIGGSTGGPPYLNEVWVYDAHTNAWTQLNNFPGGKLEGVVTFAIGNHGYAGGGWDGSSYHNAFWEYDSTSDSWTSIAAIPVPQGVADGPADFVIGSKAYVCIGGYSHLLMDGYTYDTNTKAWTVFTSMGANKIERGWAAAFSINNYGYICMGQDTNGANLNDLWQYYPCSDSLLLASSIIPNNQSHVTLYPNPNNGKFYFEFSGLKSSQSELRVTDVMGKYINSYKIEGASGKLVINENMLTNGIYFYQVLDEGKIISVGKFIIMK